MLITVGILLMVTGCSEKTENIDDMMIVVNAVEKGEEHQVLYDSETNELKYYINKEFKSKIDGEYKIENHLSLMATSESKAITIYNTNELTENVFEATIMDSTKHINHLKDNGFEIVRQVETSEFIEVYMLNNNYEVYQRLVITPNYIIISDSDTIPEFNIRDYLY
ncbi:MAG: hypothetical protein IJ593_10505 [Lachnospiraceae bacterium]|nr:hypothetical protein [Lachnospiraceae bacterium]